MIMRVVAFPPLLVLATAAYIAANPGGASLGEGPDAATREAAEATKDARSPSAIAAGLPPGTSGTLRYRSGDTLVAVSLPDAIEIERRADAAPGRTLTSADGEWTARSDCGVNSGGVQSCRLVLQATDGRATVIDQPVDLQWSRAVAWAPQGQRFALLVSADTPDGALTSLAIVDDPASGVLRTVATSTYISAFAWSGDGDSIVAAKNEGAAPAVMRIDAATGAETPIARTPELPSFFYPSPDGSQLAFTGNSGDGWHLYLLAVDASSVVRDLGAMGAGGAVPQAAPDVKVPMAIEWSPDGRALAFGGGLEPPYTMTIVDVESGAVARTEFAEGYPGEVRWSPDGTRIAVSTYDIERTVHEVYTVDPASGAKTHVLSGCVVIWSPDSRFLAIHEELPGIAIVDVETGAYGKLTHSTLDAPLTWDP